MAAQRGLHARAPADSTAQCSRTRQGIFSTRCGSTARAPCRSSCTTAQCNGTQQMDYWEPTPQNRMPGRRGDSRFTIKTLHPCKYDTHMSYDSSLASTAPGAPSPKGRRPPVASGPQPSAVVSSCTLPKMQTRTKCGGYRSAVHPSPMRRLFLPLPRVCRLHQISCWVELTDTPSHQTPKLCKPYVQTHPTPSSTVGCTPWNSVPPHPLAHTPPPPTACPKEPSPLPQGLLVAQDQLLGGSY